MRERLQRQLGDAYAITRELSGGGSASVFVATEVALNRPVVIKALPPELAAGVESRTRSTLLRRPRGAYIRARSNEISSGRRWWALRPGRGDDER